MQFCDEDNQLMLYKNDDILGLVLVCRHCKKQRPLPPDGRIFSRDTNSHTEYIKEKEERIKAVAVQSPIFRKVYRDCKKCKHKISVLFQNNANMRVQFICQKCKNVVDAVPTDKFPEDW